MPECAAHVPELFCQQKSGLRSLEKFEDAFRRSKQRVKLESEALDKKYEIFAGKEQDQVWLRRLFSPTYIVWLTDSGAEEVRLRAGRRHALLLRPRPQEERRGAWTRCARPRRRSRRGCATKRSEWRLQPAEFAQIDQRASAPQHTAGASEPSSLR